MLWMTWHRSEIGAFKMHRTIFTAVIKFVLIPYFREELMTGIGDSLYVDKSKDLTVNKPVCLCVRVGRVDRHMKEGTQTKFSSPVGKGKKLAKLMRNQTKIIISRENITPNFTFSYAAKNGPTA